MGAPVQAFTGGDDAFAAELNSSGSLAWNTFLGGSGTDATAGIAVDGSGNVYAVGSANGSWGSPVNSYSGGTDAFVAKLVKDATSTALSSSANPASYGQAVTFTATVSGAGNPTGTVTFQDGGTTLGTATLNGSGVATYTTGAFTLSVGTHSITAVYGGDID